MSSPAGPVRQVVPDFSRFNALRAEHASLVAPVVEDIEGLGRSARITVKPVRRFQAEIAYEGVSERGQDLRATFRVSPHRHSMDRGRIPDPFGLAEAWSLESYPGFHDASEDECLVGPSEDIRIREAILAAAERYLSGNAPSLLAAELIARSRSLAVREAAIRTAEAQLAADRAALATLAGEVDALEGDLSDALAPGGPVP